jgi:hypothetical protein
MVSLEDKIDYNLRIFNSPKLTAFYNLLLGKSMPIQKEDLNDSDEIYFGIINAIQTNNKTQFELYFNKKNKSNPNKESPSPFVNDDFLIFCLIVGIYKFNLDRVWIKNIISIRSRNPITETLENIINENYLSKSNLYEIVFAFFILCNQALITNEFLTTTFKSIAENINLFESRSDFSIICSITAYDKIIELKESPDGSEIKLLRQFNSKFLSRVKILSWVTQNFAIIILLSSLVKLVSSNMAIKTFFDNYDPILGVLGLSLVGNFVPIFKKKSYEILLRLLGYPKELINMLD